MDKGVDKERFPQEERGHNFQCTGIPNAKSETEPIQGESSWRRVMCECVCLFTALSLICLLARDSARGLVQYDIFFASFLKATLGDSRKDQ
jgi:hypothetical protein